MALNISMDVNNGVAKIVLEGEVDASVSDKFKEAVEKAARQKPNRLVMFMDKLTFMASAGLRILIFAKQKMGADVNIYVIGASGPVLNTLKMSGFDRSVYVQASYVD
ncbi:MAG: STAS domain-containing protein [Kiritimatiellae bacterium]|nr:STAS domain-containing protein [Kiritimatiellia bacterium]MDD5519753.1 STAS domain-containing protein [Kiritimatiellia bacterium]